MCVVPVTRPTLVIYHQTSPTLNFLSQSGDKIFQISCLKNPRDLEVSFAKRNHQIVVLWSSKIMHYKTYTASSQAMFTSYRIGFCFVSQNYTVWCEHTFPSTFMLSISLKTLNISLMFWWKKQPFEKIQEKVQQ